MKPAIFFCDLNAAQIKEAKAWSNANGAMRRDHNEHRLTFAGNIQLKVDTNEDNLKNVDNLTKDLIASACFIYQADRMITRPPKWFRELEFHIGVHDRKLWGASASQLSKIIRHLTRDTVRIQFYKFEGTRAALNLPRLVGQREGGVCVFGDNIDAVAGAAIVHGANAIVASYRYGPENPAKYNHGLINQIEKLTRPLDYVGFRIMPRKLAVRDPTQRTKGFLQLALAAAVARGIGLDNVEHIQVFGNGISSYHLRNFQLCGSGYSVRDTHPLLLKLVQELFQRLFGDDQGLKVVNQFQYLTPSAVLHQLLQSLTKDDAQKLFGEINNCSERNLARLSGVSHCGCCFSCKVRRLAALGVKFEQKDDYSTYATDPLVNKVAPGFKSKLSPRYKKRVEDYHEKGLFGFKRYIEGFRQQNDEDIISITDIGKEIIDLASETLDVGGIRTVQDMQTQIIKLHKQFAAEATPYL
jgi:hypothetical protein